MNGRGRVWRQRIGLWVPALVVFLVSLVVLTAYHASFAGEVEIRQEEVERAQKRLETLERNREELQGLLERVDRNHKQVTELYDDRFSTESRRLTQIMKEVKDLATRAGLRPNAIRYPEETLEEYDLEKRSFVFSVDGTYEDLRKLINLLELSPSFLTLEEVSLSESGGRTGGALLRINLKLSTLFAAGQGAATAAPKASERGSS